MVRYAGRNAYHRPAFDTALRLGHYFGTSAEFWLNLQKLYELRMAERESGREVRRLPRLSSVVRGMHAA